MATRPLSALALTAGDLSEDRWTNIAMQLIPIVAVLPQTAGSRRTVPPAAVPLAIPRLQAPTAASFPCGQGQGVTHVQEKSLAILQTLSTTFLHVRPMMQIGSRL